MAGTTHDRDLSEDSRASLLASQVTSSGSSEFPTGQKPGLKNSPKYAAWLQSAAFYFSFLSATAIVLSIAASQIFLGAALLSLLASRKRLRYPPLTLPLCLFFVGTVIALLLSGDPYSGLPQLKKFYVCLIALVIFNTFHTLKQMSFLILAWGAAGLLSALDSLLQFYHRYQQAHLLNANDYGFYLDGRIMGFAGHWMTFGGEEMIVLLLLLSFLLFTPARRSKWIVGACASLIWISIILGLTRSIFLLGVPMGVIYLLWNWRKWSLAALAVMAALSFTVAPVQVRERVISVFHPHVPLDSNRQRVITSRTGWRMVQAHPWFGLGPEQVGKQFLRYLPPDVPLPLPKGYYGHLHNIYLQYAAERGIPTMLMMMWLIAKALWDFRRPLNSSVTNTDIKYILHGAIAVMLALLAEGFFEYNLGDSEILTMFFAIAACGYIAVENIAFVPRADYKT